MKELLRRYDNLKMHFASALDFPGDGRSPRLELRKRRHNDLCATGISRNSFDTDMLWRRFKYFIRFTAYREVPVGNPCDELVQEVFDRAPSSLRVMSRADVARGSSKYSRNKDQTFAE